MSQNMDNMVLATVEDTPALPLALDRHVRHQGCATGERYRNLPRASPSVKSWTLVPAASHWYLSDVRKSGLTRHKHVLTNRWPRQSVVRD